MIGNPFACYPYDWTYNVPFLEVFSDGVSTYVYIDDKPCYFPSDMSIEDIEGYARFFYNIEQDVRSPHRYLTSNFDVSEDDVVVDCGAAEGFFALSVADRVKKVYVFEPDVRWLEALRKTFAPYDNVEIVTKYVSDHTDKYTLSLDDFFYKKDKPTFIKMDIEGEEERALIGASVLLETSVKKLVTACYHRANDLYRLSKYAQRAGFLTSTSEGFILTNFDNCEPYARRCLLRGEKLPAEDRQKYRPFV